MKAKKNLSEESNDGFILNNSDPEKELKEFFGSYPEVNIIFFQWMPRYNSYAQINSKEGMGIRKNSIQN